MCQNVPCAKSLEVGTRGTRVFIPCAMCHRDGVQRKRRKPLWNPCGLERTRGRATGRSGTRARVPQTGALTMKKTILAAPTGPNRYIAAATLAELGGVADFEALMLAVCARLSPK